MGFIEFLERLGGKTVEITEKPLRRIPKTRNIQERLKLLKKLQEEAKEEEKRPEEQLIEEILEKRREEVSSPLGERIADAVLKYFRGPVKKVSGLIRGLDIDLYRANIRMPKEKYVAYMIGVSFLMAFFAFAFAFILSLSPDTTILSTVGGFFGGFLYMRYYPKMVWKRRVSEVEKALPYALRHMAALLSAGVGTAEAMVSVARSDYGVLSEEFDLIIRDMRGGASFEEALLRFEERMGSEKITKVVKQMLRAIKFGGNLADILYKMAEDFSFEYRMKLVEYVQKINGISFIYMFLTIVMPTMFIIGIIAASMMSKTLVLTPMALAIIMLIAFPTISFLIINLIKSAEPR
ncbi:type II secretion system F family protein [Thermococcus sp.]